MTVDYSIVITVQKIIIDEVISACKDTRWGKAPREDGILVDILKDTEKEAHSILTHLFLQCIHKEMLPESIWMVLVILLQDKGNQEEQSDYCFHYLAMNYIQFYPRFSLISLTKTLDEDQLWEQEGCGEVYSTMDHLQTIQQLIKKTTEYEYNKP